jgi:hypothetical protein
VCTPMPMNTIDIIIENIGGGISFLYGLNSGCIDS